MELVSLDECRDQPASLYPEQSEKSRLFSEVAERFAELREIDGGAVPNWLFRIVNICERSPSAFWLVIDFLRDSSPFASKSFSQIGRTHGNRSKQAEQQQFKRDLAILEQSYPEIANVIRQTRITTAKAKEGC